MKYHVFTKKTAQTLFAAFVLFVFASIVSTIIFSANSAGAGEEHNLSGFAWSDNIGWISFNCTDLDSCATVNYGATASPRGGVLSGYAWSDNIGWISFNEGELGGCPQEPCRAVVENGVLFGWARALSFGGGWDGWISLGGTNPDYGVVQSGNVGALEGYAWGADVVGWVLFNLPFDFGGVEADVPGEAALAECEDTFDNEGDGRIDAADPGCWSDPSDATTYNPLDNDESDEPQCTDNLDNDGDNKTDENDPGCWTNPNFPNTYNPLDNDEFNILQPAFSAAPVTLIEGEATTLSFECFDSESSQGVNFSTDGQSSGTAVLFPEQTVTYSLVCSNGGEATVEVIVLHPNVTLTADPTLVQPSGVSIISWSATNVDSCVVTGPNAFLGTGTSGSESTGPLTEQSIYTITCQTKTEPIQASIIVNVLPKFEER